VMDARGYLKCFEKLYGIWHFVFFSCIETLDFVMVCLACTLDPLCDGLWIWWFIVSYVSVMIFFLSNLCSYLCSHTM